MEYLSANAHPHHTHLREAQIAPQAKQSATPALCNGTVARMSRSLTSPFSVLGVGERGKVTCKRGKLPGYQAEAEGPGDRKLPS